MALQYGLKESPCSTEWIDVCYKCTSNRAISLTMRAIRKAQKSQLKYKVPT